MTDKLKIGDKVQVLRKRPMTPESAVGKTFTIKRTGGRPEYGLNVPGATGAHSLWWYDAADLDLVRDHPRPAQILTEKVLINDIPCRKILGFEGILGRGELPEKYLESSPMFCNDGVKRGHGHFEFDGEKLRYFGSENVVNIDIKVPRGKPPEVDIGYFLMLNEGDVWPETTFQNILIWLKRAGSRLAKIRKQEKAAWSGKETIEI
jgi:hypothetical protein